MAEAEFFEFGAGGVELATAAVDEDEVGKGGGAEWWSGGGGEGWIDGLMDCWIVGLGRRRIVGAFKIFGILLDSGLLSSFGGEA